MKIVVLNGSPHIDGPTSDMVSAFTEGAQEGRNKRKGTLTAMIQMLINNETVECGENK